jgi:hypothetical protein
MNQVELIAMTRTSIIALMALLLAQPVMAETSDLDALKVAVQNARLAMDNTASKMELLVAEIDTQTLESATQSADPEAQPAEPMEQEVLPAEMVEPEAEPSESSAPEAMPATGEVSRSMFTSAIENREPVDEVVQVDSNMPRVYFFTELEGMEGQQVTHRWVYQGQVMGEVSFQVGGPRWRVHSSKNLMPEWTGIWEVQVVDAAGNVLDSRQLEVLQPAAVEPAAPPVTEDSPETGVSQ